MGRITEAKKIYDQLAVDYFISKRWCPFIIDLTGKNVADVIATRGNNVAIAEVKSICEESCGKNWDDAKHLSSALNHNIITYLTHARLDISKLFPKRNQKFERFYAISVACQLFRYFFEFEYIYSTYAKKIPPQLIAKINNPHKSAFFIVPIELSQKAVTAMNILQSNGYVVSYTVNETSRLYIIKIVYTVP